MNRGFLLSTIVLGGAVAIANASLTAQRPTAGRQQGRASVPNSWAVGAIEKVADNVYLIPGAGGNTAVYVSMNGVVLVDTKLAHAGQGILDQVRLVTDKPITHIINTHTHSDHIGSNQFFRASVEIVVQENAAGTMQKMSVYQEAANKNGLPDRTFKDRLTLLSGNDAIDIYYFGAAHTNGDAFVVFRNARVLHVGDVIAHKAQPLIDTTNGGSGIAYPDTLAKAVSTLKNVDTIIGGHSTTTMKFEDLVDYSEFSRLFLAHARASLTSGKPPEQAMKEFNLPEKFRDYNLTTGRGGLAGNFGVLFQELRQQR